MFEEVAILYTWQSESNVLTKLVTQSERECLQVRDGIDKWNVRQEMYGNTNLGLSVKFCGAISDGQDRPYTD